MDLKLKIEDPELSKFYYRIAEQQGRPVEEIVAEALHFVASPLDEIFKMFMHYKRIIALSKTPIVTEAAKGFSLDDAQAEVK